MVDGDSVFNVLQAQGPALPATVAKAVGSDILITSAVLSDLVSRNKVSMSALKVGSSPLYYLPGQETKLMQWADNLNEKDQRTYNILKEKKVLREVDCDPLTRVSLGQIKDFAIPLVVTTSAGEQETFYKWFMVSKEEATLYIGNMLNKLEQASSQATEPVTEPAQQADTLTASPPPPPAPIAEPTSASQPVEQFQEPSYSFSTESEPIYGDVSSSIEVSNAESLPAREAPPTTPQPPIPSADTEAITPNQPEPISEPQDKPALKTVTAPATPVPQIIVEEDVSTTVPIEDITDPLFLHVKDLLEEKSIELLEAEVARKGREINLQVAIPSVIGRLRYFAKVVNKKKSSDKDVSAAFLEGELQKLPLLFMYTGEVTKKAKEMSAVVDFRNLMLLKVENYGS